MIKKSDFFFEEHDLPKMSIQNWILVMFHDKDKIRSVDALSIMYKTFIFVKEVLCSMESGFGFKSSGYGPYSDKVDNAIKQLKSTNMLDMKKNGASTLDEYSYVLTESGAKKAEQIFLQLSEPLKKKVTFMNSITSKMGLTGMLQYIHSIYPEHVYLHERRGNIE
jgi:uncharacterized protein YwgA